MLKYANAHEYCNKHFKGVLYVTSLLLVLIPDSLAVSFRLLLQDDVCFDLSDKLGCRRGVSAFTGT
jgi:hypothetical protein